MAKGTMMSNFVKPRNLMVLVALVAVVGFIVYYMQSKKEHMSPMHVMDATPEEEDKDSSQMEYEEAPVTQENMTNSAPVDPHAHKDPAVQQLQAQGACFPKDQLTPEELLPQDSANEWAKANPSGAGSLKDRNFLQAGHNIGINTVGQTLRNANLQLRSEPPNPQVKVSPWQQSTIEPDVNRAPLEIGGCS